MDGRFLHERPEGGFQSGPNGVEGHFWRRSEHQSDQPGASSLWSDQAGAWSSPGARGKKLSGTHPVWQEGIGSFLLLAAAQQTGLLKMLVTTVMGIANLTMRGSHPLNPVVVDRLVRTLLFLPVAGLARTWDLRSYTGTMLANLSGREYTYSQGYIERFLARLAHAKGAELLTEAMARWTWSLWQTEQPPADQISAPAVFYVDGHRKAVY